MSAPRYSGPKPMQTDKQTELGDKWEWTGVAP